ncbi:hypothetical protein DXG01_012859 [Tephrocybe rancida]|nr:hypothetical protein DXG01_012859 [Tephrocybe rancida]
MLRGQGPGISMNHAISMPMATGGSIRGVHDEHGIEKGCHIWKIDFLFQCYALCKSKQAPVSSTTTPEDQSYVRQPSALSRPLLDAAREHRPRRASLG